MTKKLHIEGMSCNHCVMHVKNALNDVDGVVKADVSLKDNLAVVELSQDVNNQALIDAVTEAGYTVTQVE